MDFFRHGDVDGRRIDKLPEKVRKLPTKTVMYGEATGHHHTFSGQVVVYEPTEPTFIHIGNDKSQVLKYVHVKEQATITHQEHPARDIMPGIYAITKEREFDPLEQQIRPTMD